MKNLLIICALLYIATVVTGSTASDRLTSGYQMPSPDGEVLTGDSSSASQLYLSQGTYQNLNNLAYDNPGEYAIATGNEIYYRFAPA